MARSGSRFRVEIFKGVVTLALVLFLIFLEVWETFNTICPFMSSAVSKLNSVTVDFSCRESELTVRGYRYG